MQKVYRFCDGNVTPRAGRGNAGGGPVTSKARASPSRLVSNRGMRGTILNLCVLLLTGCLWAQSSVHKTEKVAIERARNLIVSSFDRRLPDVSLESFLKYEGEGAQIEWKVKNCGDQTGDTGLDRGHGSPMCVEADFEFKGQTAVAILVSVGTFSRPSGVPALVGVTITENGTSRSVRHLGALPAELHRPPPRLPRDLPVPGGATVAGPNDGKCTRKIC